MDVSMRLRHLAEAERHIKSGAERISKQELCIADLDYRGQDSMLARTLLKTFCLLQAEHIAHRDRILRELGQ
ncbi:hypothetical protein [Bradyrhizobium sp. STM 3562]|uniref:hypothetical protein n=1 Tax=Bradyrhizobium sp. STM 3562 TaxID=578924 RepID=UPI0038900FCF